MHLREKKPPTLDEIKRELRQHNVKVHRDMTGPVDIIDGETVAARSTMAEAVVTLVLRDKKTNFAAYTVQGAIIRYAAW